MTEGETEGIPGETQGKLPKRDRVAVCLNCTNEWVAHTGNAKKPSKCPICGSKRCAWRDEITPNTEKSSTLEEDKTVFPGETEGIPRGNPGEDTGYILPDGSGFALGTIYGPGEGPEDPGNHSGELKTDPEELPTKGGFPLVLGLIILVLLGTLAGVGWFLGRRPKRRTGPINSGASESHKTDPSEALKMRLSYGGIF
jgi:DNA-directed RNA polymerase subunit RPC12/RpoP